MTLLRAGALCLTLALPAAAPVRADDTVTGDWRFTSVGGTDLPADPPVTLRLDADGRATGSSGCNRFTGTWVQTDGRLTFGPLAGTRMACPPDLMDREAQVLDALARTDGFARDAAGGLVLHGGETPLATLARSAPAD